jgi:hypothetical protein
MIGPRARIRAYRWDPKRRFGSAVRERYGYLGPDVLDALFANYKMAMSVDLVARLDRLCRGLRPRLVIEFGSGVSTIAMQAALSGTGGRLVTVEESVDWLCRTAGRIRDRDGLVFVACEEPSGPYEALAAIVGPSRHADLLVVDGPSRGNRFTDAAFQVYDALAGPGTVWAIDDTHRPDNDEAAALIAGRMSLRKLDYGDPIGSERRFALLVPHGVDEAALEGR